MKSSVSVNAGSVVFLDRGVGGAPTPSPSGLNPYYPVGDVSLSGFVSPIHLAPLVALAPTWGLLAPPSSFAPVPTPHAARVLPLIEELGGGYLPMDAGASATTQTVTGVGALPDFERGDTSGPDSKDPTWTSFGLAFDGSNDRVSGTIPSMPQDRTIVAIVRSKDTKDNQFVWRDSETARVDNEHPGVIRSGFGGTELTSVTLANNTWYSMIWVYDQTAGVLFYLNGLPEGNFGSSFYQDTLSTSVQVGTVWNGDIAYIGWIPDVAASSSQAATLHNDARALVQSRGISLPVA